MNYTATKVIEWGALKGILSKSNAISQHHKLLEEVEELYYSLSEDDPTNTALEIGDCMVVLILIAALRGLDVDECLDAAYEKIKDRRGKMVDGKFVKE